MAFDTQPFFERSPATGVLYDYGHPGHFGDNFKVCKQIIKKEFPYGNV